MDRWIVFVYFLLEWYVGQKDQLKKKEMTINMNFRFMES